MTAAELIQKKRDGGTLSREEIFSFVQEYTRGALPEYQTAALLMAVYFQGMTPEETAHLTEAMLRSGEVLDLSGLPGRKVDKHSTGGVGDKISLPLAPAAAACGAAVPMVSGRGLGHTGGTLDKLEAIPGFRVHLPVQQFRDQVARLGVCLIGQTDRVAPADRRLYALRDVTGTVESIPLIASSIMSKKLAEGIDGLVLDCKVGDGAFMKSRAEATQLGRAIQSIGAAAGVPTSVLLTDMEAPIGRLVGNAVEVVESIEVLRGKGPPDTRELTVALGGEMLALAGLVDSTEEGKRRIACSLDDGSALELFRRVVEAQGGDPHVVDDPAGVLPQPTRRTPVVAGESGTVAAVAAREIGVAALVLGAGRRRVEDAIDPAAGIELTAHLGDRVEAGQPLAFLLSSRASDADIAAARDMVLAAYRVGQGAAVQPASRVLEILR